MTKKKKPAIRLRVGGVYETRGGARVKVEGVDKNGALNGFPLACSDAWVRRSDGLFYGPERKDSRDLIREVSAPKPATARKAPRKAAKPVMAWGVRGVLVDDLRIETQWDYRDACIAAREYDPKRKIVRVRIVEVRR